jgi:hypothetical protein
MRRRIFYLAAIAALCGCQADPDALIPVSGSVKYSDGSVPSGESAVIWFEPVAGGNPASGNLDSDGSFELTTSSPGDGVRAGTYKVVLKILRDYRAQISAVPENYGDAATTPLEATVDADHTQFEFTVDK